MGSLTLHYSSSLGSVHDWSIVLCEPDIVARLAVLNIVEKGYGKQLKMIRDVVESDMLGKSANKHLKLNDTKKTFDDQLVESAEEIVKTNALTIKNSDVVQIKGDFQSEIKSDKSAMMMN